MTGAEQRNLNEVGRAVDALTATVSGGFEKLDARLQRLEDDKVARDALAAARVRSFETSRWALTIMVTAGAAIATLLGRIIFG